jgi:hypothetical protein
MPPADLAALDGWITRQSDALTRPEAIRRLVEQALSGTTAGRLISAGSRRKAADMAGREVDQLGDQAVTDEERARRKRRLVKGPSEFRDIRGDQPKKR